MLSDCQKDGAALGVSGRQGLGLGICSLGMGMGMGIRLGIRLPVRLQACRAGCRRRPLTTRLPRGARSAPSAGR